MKLSDYIVSFFEERNVEYVFGFIGGAITHLVDSFSKNQSVKFLQFYHEQNAAFAAEGYSLLSPSIGVALATSGPGATNMITGIADAYFDSIPVIYITGQVNTYEYKYNKPVRQQGFQETDIVSIVSSITKYSVLVDDPLKIRYELEKAMYIAKSGRPGPVLLDIPMDIQRAEIDVDKLETFKSQELEFIINDDQISKISDLLYKSKRPLILAGGGVISSNAEEQLFNFSKKNNISVVVSLKGKGSYPEDDDLFLGMIGSYGNRSANIALANSDFVIVLGSRLDTRQTGTDLSSFVREGYIIHVDIDVNELDHSRIERREKVLLDVKVFLASIEKHFKTYQIEKTWLSYLQNLKDNHSQELEIEKNITNKVPYNLMRLINKHAKDFDIITVDIGHNQMIAAQMLQIIKKQKFITSGGMAPMGFAIPVAIGASFATNLKKKILTICGDGGFHLSVQSLMIISQYNLPIKIIVLNNHTLGMIVQFQNLYFNGNKQATTQKEGYSVPDLYYISKAYSLHYHCIESNKFDEKKISSLLNEPGPAIIEFIVDDTDVSPKLEVKNPIENTSPKLSIDELKKVMLIDLFK